MVKPRTKGHGYARVAIDVQDDDIADDDHAVEMNDIVVSGTAPSRVDVSPIDRDST